MIEDLRTRPDGETVDTDLCIIGAGAAGITLASEFADTSTQVILLEGGGTSLETPTQDLYEAENVGLARKSMIRSRLRFFGGTTNHWSGRCAPFDDLDFRPRPWVPHSGWPIGRADLEPYYQKALDVCDLGANLFDERILAKFHVPDPRIDRQKLQLQYWKASGPTRFGVKYRKRLDEARNIRVLLHANVTGLQANHAASHLDYIDAKSLDGRTVKIRARRVVVCCGGIDNARLLLLSDSVQRGGLGNGKDLVGRYLQEHIRSWQFAVPTLTPFSLKKIYNFYTDDTGTYLIGLRATDELQTGRQLLNAVAFTYSEAVDYSPSDAALRIVRELVHRQQPEHLADDVWNVLSGFDEILMNLRARFLLTGNERRADTTTTLVVETEQCPNPDSRITLSDQRDALGLRRAKIDWRLTDLDRHSSLEMLNTIATEWGRLNQARVRLPEWLNDNRTDWANNIRDVGHHIGTTRMADDPQHGVVDQHCRVHGIDNLYIAGASVFPTSGSSVPTFNIVALALRLADHLKGSAS